MLRIALIVFGSVVALLFVVTLLPERRRAIPDSSITLSQTSLTLYPQEDPEAVWFFSTPEALYNPDTSETLMRSIENGERRILEDDRTDFTIESEELTITGDDNLRADNMLANMLFDVENPDDDYLLDMEGNSEEGSQILINQREGVFEIPFVTLTGDGVVDEKQNMRIGFDFEVFESGGEGTRSYSQFELEDRDGE